MSLAERLVVCLSDEALHLANVDAPKELLLCGYSAGHLHACGTAGKHSLMHVLHPPRDGWSATHCLSCFQHGRVGQGLFSVDAVLEK